VRSPSCAAHRAITGGACGADGACGSGSTPLEAGAGMPSGDEAASIDEGRRAARSIWTTASGMVGGFAGNENPSYEATSPRTAGFSGARTVTHNGVTRHLVSKRGGNAGRHAGSAPSYSGFMEGIAAGYVAVGHPRTWLMA
jgi:hypothetical protein